MMLTIHMDDGSADVIWHDDEYDSYRFYGDFFVVEKTVEHTEHWDRTEDVGYYHTSHIVSIAARKDTEGSK